MSSPARNIMAQGRASFRLGLIAAMAAIALLSNRLDATARLEVPTPPHSRLESAVANGLVRVGVEFPPREPGPGDYQIRRAGSFIAEIGQSIEARLSTNVRFVRVAPGSEAEALANGSIDLALVARPPNSTWPRDDAFPVGRVARLAPLMRDDTPIQNWEDMRGKKICFSDDDGQARRLIERLNGIPMPTSAPAKALAAMRAGECDASLHDADLMNGLASMPGTRWAKFSATLPPRHATQLTFIAAEGDDWAERALRGSLSRWKRGFWKPLIAQWIVDVDFEVYLEQDAPDCH